MVFTIDIMDNECDENLNISLEVKKQIAEDIEKSLLSFYNNFNDMVNVKKFNIKNQKSIIKSIR